MVIYNKHIIFIIVGFFSYKLTPVLFQMGEFYRLDSEDVWIWIFDLSGSVYFLVSLIFIIVFGISIANFSPWFFGFIVALFSAMFSAFIFPCNFFEGEVEVPILLLFLVPMSILNITRFVRK